MYSSDFQMSPRFLRISLKSFQNFSKLLWNLLAIFRNEITTLWTPSTPEGVVWGDGGFLENTAFSWKHKWKTIFIIYFVIKIVNAPFPGSKSLFSLFSRKTLFFSQKILLFSQKILLFSQKILLFSQKILLFSQKILLFSQKRLLF